MKYGRITRLDFEDIGSCPQCDLCGERRARYKDYRYIRYTLTRFLTCGTCIELPDDEFIGILQAKKL
jgi:hypothetical protein